MFTGIIRQLGQVAAHRGGSLRLACPTVRSQLALGDSVAVNGVCLTAARLTDDGFEADLLEETLRNTTLASLPAGGRVNMELAAQVGDRLGGHIVQGHVDGTVELLELIPRGADEHELTFTLPKWLAPYAVDRGSICLDGVSLTLQRVDVDRFNVGLIPATWRETAFSDIAAGRRVNVEIDYFVKTVRHSLEHLLPAMLADRGQDKSQAAS